MKACKDCKHLHWTDFSVGCYHPSLLKDDPMYGKVGVSHYEMRKPNAPCGPEANLWERKTWWQRWFMG